MKTVKELCTPADSVFSISKADTIASIGDLKTIDAQAFFRENHVTEGMRTLFSSIFDRLLGSGLQGVFRLKQAMGGGRTHSLIATGLLARNVPLRRKIMSESADLFFQMRYESLHLMEGKPTNVSTVDRSLPATGRAHALKR